MSFQPLVRFDRKNNLANYAPMAQAYPLTTMGMAGDYCIVDSDCHPAFNCKQNLSGTRSCRPPEQNDMCWSCYRDPVDKSCKRTLQQTGKEVYCPEDCCQRKSRYVPPGQSIVPADDNASCENTFMYTFLPHGGSGQETMYCAKFNPDNGEVIPANPACCENGSQNDWTPEWIKYSISPMMYGVYR